MCLGGSELRPGNRQKENGHRLQGVLGLGQPQDGHNGKKRRGVLVEAMTYEEIEANILRSMDALGTKPEDYAEMIQRVLAKKAQQRAECGESSKVSRLDIPEEENREEDMNL